MSAIVYAMRHELMEMGLLPSHHDLEHLVERGQTDIARDLDSAPDGGFTVPEGDFELVDGKGRRWCCSLHRCFPVRLSLSRFMMDCAFHDKRHQEWPVYGLLICSLAPQSSSIALWSQMMA